MMARPGSIWRAYIAVAATIWRLSCDASICNRTRTRSTGTERSIFVDISVSTRPGAETRTNCIASVSRWGFLVRHFLAPARQSSPQEVEQPILPDRLGRLTTDSAMFVTRGGEAILPLLDFQVVVLMRLLEPPPRHGSAAPPNRSSRIAAASGPCLHEACRSSPVYPPD